MAMLTIRSRIHPSKEKVPTRPDNSANRLFRLAVRYSSDLPATVSKRLSLIINRAHPLTRIASSLLLASDYIRDA